MNRQKTYNSQPSTERQNLNWRTNQPYLIEDLLWSCSNQDSVELVKEIHIDKWNGTEDLEIDPHK